MNRQERRRRNQQSRVEYSQNRWSERLSEEIGKWEDREVVEDFSPPGFIQKNDARKLARRRRKFEKFKID